MRVYGDFLPKLICDPWSMFVTFFIPNRIPAEIIGKFIVFALNVLDIIIISVCRYNNVRDFVRDVIKRLAIVDVLQCFLIASHSKVWTSM